MEDISSKKGLRNIPKVIVVDDDFDMVDIVTEYLEKIDLAVVGTGHNGKEAVTLFHNLHPDVVILDMKMPEYDGRYAIENIKKEDPRAKIIVSTGYADDYHFKENEVTSILRKPFNIEQLVEAIDLALVKN